MIGPRSIDPVSKRPSDNDKNERPRLRDHKSAKLLIRQYEAIGGTAPALEDISLTRVRSNRRQQLPEGYKHRGFSSTIPSWTRLSSQTQKKEKSPLRQSFLNLFSVLKKGKTVLSKNRSDEKVLFFKALTPTSAEEGSPQTIPIDELPVLPLAQHEPVIPKPKKQTGVLMYLASSTSPHSFSNLLWTSTTTTLEGNKITVLWFTSDGYPCAREIDLFRCTDIRSISLKSLNSSEIAALPPTSNNEQLKIFEILFEGRARERFAAACVRDRARWISTIWDAVLPPQETRGAPQAKSIPLAAAKEIENSKLAMDMAIPTSPPAMSLTHSERSLPPVPQKPILSALTIPGKSLNHVSGLPVSSPVSPSIYSTASLRPPSTRPSSPSITNLSQLSRVKQRLAQIERSSSQGSDSSEVRSPISVSGRKARFGSSQPVSPLASRQAIPNANLILDTPFNFHSASPRQSSPIEQPRAQNNSSHDVDSTHILEGISDVKGVLGGQPGCPTIHQIVLGLDHRLVGTHDVLKQIQEGLHGQEEGVGTRLRTSTNSRSDAELLQMLQNIKVYLNSELPALNIKVSELKTHQLANEGAIQPSSVVSAVQPVDLAPVHEKLEALLKICSSEKDSAASPEGVDRNSELAKIISILNEEKESRGQQTLQQADSVRYLNELNTWLEAFVNNGTSQIHGLANSIDRLCADLGSTNKSKGGTSFNVLHDVRQLVLGMKARDQHLASLQAGVSNLLGVLNSESRLGLDSEAIAGMIENQQRNHENMFRTFTNEISGEIKGERLRFVEAMKEATAINVQLHVEHFKKELGREVLGMTKEVERLHRDKQKVQNQIADLFSFYSKQKSGAMPSAPHAVPHIVTRPHGHSRRISHYPTQARPLPIP